MRSQKRAINGSRIIKSVSESTFTPKTQRLKGSDV